MSINNICNNQNARHQLPIKSRIDSSDFIGSQSLSSNIIRRDASYIGGTGGPNEWVNYGLGVVTTSRPQTGQNEWALVGVNNNQSNDPLVENNGIYAQINKSGDSKSWALTAEARETQSNFTSSLVGMELDLFGNSGNKNVKSKVGLDLIIGKHNTSGAKIQPYAGIFIGSSDSDSVDGKYAIEINPNDGVKTGNSWDRTIKLYDGAKIAFSDDQTYFTFNSTSSKFEFYRSGILVGAFP